MLKLVSDNKKPIKHFSNESIAQSYAYGVVIRHPDGSMTATSDVVNYNNPLERQLFDQRFGFHEDSLNDVPKVNSIRHFQVQKDGLTYDVFVGENAANVSISVNRFLAETLENFTFTE